MTISSLLKEKLRSAGIKTQKYLAWESAFLELGYTETQAAKIILAQKKFTRYLLDNHAILRYQLSKHQIFKIAAVAHGPHNIKAYINLYQQGTLELIGHRVDDICSLLAAGGLPLISVLHKANSILSDELHFNSEHIFQIATQKNGAAIVQAIMDARANLGPGILDPRKVFYLATQKNAIDKVNIYLDQLMGGNKYPLQNQNANSQTNHVNVEDNQTLLSTNDSFLPPREPQNDLTELTETSDPDEADEIDDLLYPIETPLRQQRQTKIVPPILPLSDVDLPISETSFIGYELHESQQEASQSVVWCTLFSEKNIASSSKSKNQPSATSNPLMVHPRS